MPAPFNTIDLATLALKAGEGRRLEVDLTPDPLELGGETYDLGDDPIAARLDVSRTTSGHAMRLGFGATLHGRCMRCLEPSEFEVEVEAREVDQPGTGDDELSSPYVEGDDLDLASWAHDAIALALPQTLLCRPDCKGLCPQCGIPLNDIEGEHTHEREPDPRWSKLRELMD